MEKQMKLFTYMTKPFVLFVLLFALGVGSVWGNYAYLDLSGYTAWYNDNAYFQVNFNGTVIKNPEEVNGKGCSGVWRFNVGENSGSCTFQRMQPNTENQWNYYNGSLSASQNVARITGGDNGEMRTAFVINYIHGTNHVYFDNSVSNFTDNIYFVIGHDYSPTGSSNEFSIAYKMTPVTGTKLYHVEITGTWEDAMYYAIIADDAESISETAWGSSSLGSTDRGDKGYTAAYKTVYNMEGGSYLITTASSGNGKDMTINYYADKDALPKVNASQAAKKRDTGTAYSNVSGDWPATLNLIGSYMKNATDTGRSVITSTASGDGPVYRTYGVIQSGTVTQSYTSLNTSYHFEGWGTGSAPTNTEATNEYHISTATTVYAFFSKLYTLSYDVKGDYDTSTVAVYSVDNFSGSTGSGDYIPTGHMITIVAKPATGYEVKGWYSDASCETEYTNGDGGVTIESGNNTFKLASLNANTGVYPKFGPKTYTITLEDMVPTTEGQGSVSVTYNASTNMTSSDPVTKPTKTHYTFDGYWTSENTGTTLDHQLIDGDGKWIADKTGYTSHDGEGNPTWVHDYPISLYAKWIEKSHKVTVAVSAGAYDGTPGTVQISSTDVTEVTAGEVTWSPVMTPIANPGWKFKEWQKTSNIDFDEEHYHSDYQSSTTNSMVIKSYADNQTITAVFEPRYYLVGGELVGDDDDITTSGMPGWGNYDAPFIVTTSSPLLATCTCTLTNADKTYKILVRDKNDGISYGVNTNPFEVIQDGESLLFDDANCKVFLYAKGGTTFTFKITDVDASGHPYVSLDRPHQLHFGTGYAGIDNLSSVTNGTTGGTLAVTTSAGSLSNEDWVTYGTDVTYTPSAATGYTFEGFYTSNTYSSRFTQDNPWVHYNVTSDDNVYAKFVETSTSVTLANDGHGHVEIGGVTRTDTIVGITTHRKIVGVPDVGYKFSSWTKTSGSDYNIDDLSSDTATLSGNGGGATSGQTVTANFTYRWALKAESVGWGETQFIIENISTNASGDVVGYVEISLAANKNYQFTMKDLLTNDIYKNNNVAVQYMTYSTHENWDFATTYTYNCGITTAGKGTYRFTWNITHKTMTVTYPDSYQVNYGASPSVGGSITVVDDDSQAVPNGGYVRSGGNVTYTATPNDGYTFVGWCNDNSYGDPFTTYNPWPNNSVTATSNAYAKFKSTNFVIYRTGDMEDDPRAAYDDVESFDGGTISEVIELRMKVHELDKWYSLYLPYTVDSVCVYDVDEAKYYKMQPYFRKTLGGKLYAGHYIIRKPELTNDSIALSNFGDWRDPSSSTFTPSGNTPYIIQWHNSYFEGKYVSFFGAASQSIASSFSEGEAPKTKNWVTVHGNNSMKSGSVVDAYTLDGDEIWVRPVDKGKSVAILPFECYIRANSEVTNKYLVLRRGMNTDDTPTGWESVSIPSEKASKVLMDGQLYIIRGNQIYTIQGALVK